MSNSYNEKKVLVKAANTPVCQESIVYENFYVACPEVFGVDLKFVFFKTHCNDKGS